MLCCSFGIPYFGIFSLECWQNLSVPSIRQNLSLRTLAESLRRIPAQSILPQINLQQKFERNKHPKDKGYQNLKIEIFCVKSFR